MKYSKLITLLLALLMCFTFVLTASAASELSITAETQVSAVEYGDTVKVAVKLSSNPGNLGVNFDIKWDTNSLEVVSVDISGSAFKTVEANQQDKRIVVTIANPLLGLMAPDSAEQVTGTGKVLDVTFKVKANADTTTMITFERASYVAIGGESSDSVGLNPVSFDLISSNHKHTPGAEATCTTNQICTICFAELAPAKGHNAVVDAAVASTCSKTGLTEGSHCSVCNEVLVKQNTVPTLPHTPGKEATCTSNQICTVCSTVLKYALPHTSAVAATCSAQAVCDVCGNAYGELLPHTPGPEATCSSAQTCTVCNAVIAEKLDHELEIFQAQAPTCDAAGWDEYEKCKNCDYTSYEELAATGDHAYGEWVVVKDATAEAAGEKQRTCTDCGAVESEVIPVLEKEPADFSWIIFVILGVLVVIVVIIIIVVKKKKNNG